MITSTFAEKLICMKSRSKTAVTLAVEIHNSGVMSIDDLMKRKEFDRRNIMETLKKLSEDGLTDIVSSEGVLYCCSPIKNYDIDACEDCDKRRLKKIDLNGTEYKRRVCRESNCVFNKDFMNVSAVKLLKKVSKKTELNIGNKTHGGDTKVTTLTMCRLFNNLWSKYYKSVDMQPNNRIVSEAMVVIINMFKSEVSGRYREFVPKYIEDAFKVAKKLNTSINLKNMSMSESVKAYIKSKSLNGVKKQVRRKSECPIHGIVCSYWKSGHCELEIDGIKCDVELRRAMKERYGEEK